jgi:nucleotide-binding universal stress UspA family protein
MFKHILVPTDLTERSMQALEIAVKMADYSTSLVTLLHVIETIEDTECDQFADFYEKLGKRAEKRMDQMISLYKTQRLTISKEITYGKRVNEIIRFAQEKTIDLIILSSHRIEAQTPSQGWGSISYKVGILSHCPVMLVK